MWWKIPRSEASPWHFAFAMWSSSLCRSSQRATDVTFRFGNGNKLDIPIYRYIYTQHVQSPKTACHPPSSAGIHTTITFKRWMFPWMTPYIYGRSSLHTTQKTIDISIGNKNPKTLLIFQYVLYIFNHIFIHFSWCVYPLSFSSHSIWGFLGAQIFPLPLRCPWRTFTSGGELVKAPGIQQVIMSWSSWYHDG